MIKPIALIRINTRSIVEVDGSSLEKMQRYFGDLLTDYNTIVIPGNSDQREILDLDVYYSEKWEEINQEELLKKITEELYKLQTENNEKKIPY